MDLQKLLRERSHLRRIFKRHIHDEKYSEIDIKFLESKINRIQILDKLIQEILLEDSTYDDENIRKEYDECEELEKDWLKITWIRPSTSINDPIERSHKLPKMDIKKFDDDPKSWIAFWTQYEKIHLDTRIQKEDKFAHLLYCMAEQSKARTLVESYPPTAQNYDKVIETLKKRFARDEILIEIYVREILDIVIAKNSLDIVYIFDKISVNLQILESLGIGREKYECILLPLIESSLPDDILLLWAKIPTQGGSSKLQQLMAFLENEVEAQGRCNLAKSFYGNCVPKEVTPTTSCFTTKQENKGIKDKEGKVIICFFCDKGHNTLECSKADRLSLDEKKNAIKKKGGCYICLKKGHLAKFCKAFIRCMYCSKRHVVVLCPTLHAQRKTCEQNEEKHCENNVEIKNNFTINNKTTLLQTLVVKVATGKQDRKVRVLLDSGSQRTYIKRELAEDLGLQVVGSENLGHSLFSGVKKPAQMHRIFKFKVSSLDNKYCTTMTALEQDVICGSLPKVQDPDLINSLRMNQIKLTDLDEDIRDIGLLIGSDQLGFIIINGFIRIDEKLVAIPTKLGWTLQGPIQGVFSTTVSSHFVSLLQTDSLEFLWDIEMLGIKDPYGKQEKNEILNSFKKCISVNEEGRYEMGLMWKDNCDLDSNYNQAYRRLMSTTKKLENARIIKEYNEVIKDWEKEGIIEEVKEDNISDGHYLPHHAVIKWNSATTKIRPVFDASCKGKNKKSLNDCIDKGPNLIEEIPKLLFNFRSGAYGVIADIKKAFLQISISLQDRKYLKLLWWKEKQRKIITYQHARVPFGIACSPFLLAVTIYHHLEKEKDNFKATANRLRNSFYVDNCVTSFDTPEEVKAFEEEATSLMMKGKFELRGWMSNSVQKVDAVSVLGVQWDRLADDLCCNINIKSISERITKRDLLSIVQQIFDPIGFLSPITLVPRLIMQKAWMIDTGWDEEIPTELKKEYKEWISSIDCINKCKIPRRLSEKPLGKCKVTLHVFSDASKEAYAGCVFLRTEYQEHVTIRLAIAKSRVAPIKRQMTLPRLELLGALLASRLYKEFLESGVLSNSNNYRTYCWTDSSVVLAWLKREETWGAFVRNRVKEICRNTNKANWNHLPGIYNPADLPSRGCKPKTLLENMWWMGPEWLYSGEEDWPKSEINAINAEEDVIASELTKSVAVCMETNADVFSSRLLYFSKYKKIVRLVARLLRLSPRIRNKYTINSLHIGNEEYRNAEETIIKIVQKETYTEKVKDKRLLTVEIDGVVRVKTRLAYSGESRDFIYPILLPGKNELIYRMIREKHKDMQHAGTQTMLTELRNTYWITGVRRLSKKIVSECIVCRRYNAKHYEAPVPPLPTDRIGNTAPFEVSGIDLAGPLILKGNTKCWIVLYTCAVYRAVHLELTDSLSTAGFIMTLRRFISRRGRVRIIYTDNGTNFVGTANLLKEVNWSQLEEETSSYNIQWRFSAPAAPWWGGWWERLIRVVKDMLRRILGRASVNWIELSTILCDCEAVINSRPLTYVEMGDVRPLTPMMFLHGLPHSDTPDLDQVDHHNLNIRYKYLQQLREDFRKRFKYEYLSLLITKGKENKNEPKVGDVVIIQTESKHRLHWPIGIIKEIFTGKDGSTRTARVKTAAGEKVRPYQRLFPLEISAASQEWLSHIPVDKQPLNAGSTTSDVSTYRNPILPLGVTTKSGRTVRLPIRF